LIIKVRFWPKVAVHFLHFEEKRMTGIKKNSHQGWCQVLSNKSLHPPPDASVTALVYATGAPDAGVCELKR
jgi:hypothetical protein